jgi:hypothetical protein
VIRGVERRGRARNSGWNRTATAKLVPAHSRGRAVVEMIELEMAISPILDRYARARKAAIASNR